MVRAMCNLTSRVFEHLDITSSIHVDERINYTKLLLRGASLKKYKSVVTECKELTKELAGDQWNIGDIKELSTERLWTWDKEDEIENGGYAYLGLDKCIEL